MGKLSISVPADLERALRARAREENTSISAILTEAARRDLDAARNLAEAQRLLAESIAEHGPLSDQDKRDVAAFLDEVEEFDRRHGEEQLGRAS
ncbi:ribbon-helix-helix protein, CopG family [Streptomyces albus]|uniref:ribbon-helix-helix protein, CopG family n=1 Tax=Streptomyces albus TaxID=1888 RepID=UPI0004CA7561|nr:ribbon-helix-helix protein, CopG family [Streptomyces albus]